MVLFPSLLNGFARKKSCPNDDDNDERKAVKALAKEARKNGLLLSSSGTVKSSKANNFASIFTKKGQKGVNQDRLIVWEEFGWQEDMILCGVFDGHGPWGHYVSKSVMKLVPASLLCNLKENLAATSLDLNYKMEADRRNHHEFDIWKQACIKTCAAVDHHLKQNTGIDSFQSGTTALTVIKQGEDLIISNLGDSRAVLATTSDEPGVYRVWMPNGKTPGLAISRALGDYCVKDFGLISVPEVTQRKLNSRDQFLILASDGVWDVISNQEAVKIVGSSEEKGKAAERLVKCAKHEWKRKRRGIAIDDISAICLFFQPHNNFLTPPSYNV
ncbi:hypothetical protein Ahy_B04g070220 isoform C [Arachis hypogaea]|uniref:PPM-type phosphatase domain-containing protein n=1 Tax=Arachis hypogaea TaxID=3818 RepID=A0A444ZFM6_ARAHY|nr:hypothetical protein Ahy_B04g070220 isoform C [Arachis hypogaea]